MSAPSPLRTWLASNTLEPAVSWSRPPPATLSAPWRVPETMLRSKDVNRLLEFSLQLQSSTLQTQLRTTEELQLLELRHYILSNAGPTLHGLLSRYLTAIGIKNSVVCGVYKPSVVDYDGLKGVPSVFLKIGDTVIDNTYLHQTEKATQKKNVKDFYSMMPGIRTPKAYHEEAPSVTTLPMVGTKAMGDDPAGLPAYLEAACANPASMKKHLANVMRNEDLHPGEVLFDMMMRKFIKEEFEVEVGSVVEEAEAECWGCGEAQGTLSLCSGCHFARYCGKECIGRDWSEQHKLMHRVNKKFQQRREERSLSLAKLKI